MKITVATCKIKKQVESILRSSLDEIITIHRNTHDMISGTVPNEGTDIHCFQNFQESIENLRDFKENRIRISLSICIDGFPLYKRTKYSVTPIQLHIRSLSAHSRCKKKNNIIVALIGGSAKPSEKIMKTIFEK
ncbi:hypothetical protein PMAYCL1PPCAC_23161, partial [Pristionchus mayeri]